MRRSTTSATSPSTPSGSASTASAFKDLLPSLWLPTFLRQRLGYRAHALVSMPVLNPATPLARDFDSFALMPTHNDMAAMLPRLALRRRAADLPPAQRRRDALSVRAAERGSEPLAAPVGPARDVCAASTSRRRASRHRSIRRSSAELRARQIEAVRYLDGVFEQLFDLLPANTYVTVTADHGELFGEDGYVGHGPIQHDKVFEVPFLEGRLR